MTADSSAAVSGSSSQDLPKANHPGVESQLQVNFKTEAGHLLLLLPPQTEVKNAAISWSDTWQQFQQRLSAGKRFWQPQTSVYLLAGNRLLDGRQLQAIADALSEAQLQLKQVRTNRRQTAVAAASAGYSVEQDAPVSPLSQPAAPLMPALAEPVYLQTTVRSGVEIRHAGTVVILGDLNPGSSVVADGDILVWGRLRGVAHAGARGNTQCRIMALQMQPTQLRIADQVARAPETTPNQFYPEVAYVTSEGIWISRATDFSKMSLPLSKPQELP